MIPKIIHYCWFGRGLMPKSQKDCIRGWKRLMPDYTFMRWDESTFPLDKYPLAKYACEAKRYALASDICRYNVLSKYGGIYLDTDVELFQRLDKFLDCNFFSAIELYNEFETEHIREQYLNEDATAKDPTRDVPRLEILTSTMGSAPKLKLICDIRDWYNSAEASYDRASHYRDWVNNDRMVARYLTKYGFHYVNKTQFLKDNMVVYGTGLFGYAFSPDSQYEVSFHHNAATWEAELWSRTKRHEMFFDKLGLLTAYRKYKYIKRKIKSFLLTPKQGEVWCLHRVLPKRSAFKSNRDLEITPDYLNQLIATKKKEGYTFVSLETILSNSSRLRRKLINISFDDGFRDVYEYAFPILKRENIPFTLFLTTGMPNGTAHLWWLELEKMVKTPEEVEPAMKEIYDSRENMSEYICKKYNASPDYSLTKRVSLTWNQIQEMVDSGLCVIGSHTCSHPALTRVSEERIQEELSMAKQQIIEHLGKEPVYFSYPHSMENSEVRTLVKQTGHKAAFMGYGGSVHKGDDLFKLNRKHIVQS